MKYKIPKGYRRIRMGEIIKTEDLFMAPDGVLQTQRFNEGIRLTGGYYSNYLWFTKKS